MHTGTYMDDCEDSASLCAMPSLMWQFMLILLLTMSFSPSSNHLHHLIVAPSLPSCRHHCHGVSHTPCIMIPSAMAATPRHPTSRSPCCPHFCHLTLNTFQFSMSLCMYTIIIKYSVRINININLHAID